MDALREFLEDLKRHDLARQHFLGLLHLLIGRRLARADATPISSGMTWRELAVWLKKVRWDADMVCALGLDPNDLPPRDRERYWYTAIARAGVDAAKAIEDADRLAVLLQQAGYVIGPAPGK